jgi:hypothetical protein
MLNFKVGDRVELAPLGEFHPATVQFDDGPHRKAVVFDDTDIGHGGDCDFQPAGGGVWFFSEASHYDVRPLAPKQKQFSPTSQNGKLLAQMKSGRSVTRVTAFSYGVMNLTARIADLRNGGYDVKCDNRVDCDGSRYGSFKLAA